MNADADYRWIELNPDYRSRLQRFECAEQHDWLAPAGVDVVKKHGSAERHSLDDKLEQT